MADHCSTLLNDIHSNIVLLPWHPQILHEAAKSQRKLLFLGSHYQPHAHLFFSYRVLKLANSASRARAAIEVLHT